MIALYAAVFVAGVVLAVVIANTRRYRRIVRRPGYLPIQTPTGHRRLP